MSPSKAAHCIILDAGPILRNDPSISTLLAKSEQIFTVSSIFPEIKDVNARSRVETTLLPFLTIRDPSLKSIKVVTDFARKTGDLPILSQTDIAILALAYELEYERNGGDWRLRRNPGQKGINGPVPRDTEPSLCTTSLEDNNEVSAEEPSAQDASVQVDSSPNHDVTLGLEKAFNSHSLREESQEHDELRILNQYAEPDGNALREKAGYTKSSADVPEESDSESSGSEGWITPSNLRKQQAKDKNSSMVPVTGNRILQVATITTDFAMQNVLLQMGLNLLSTSVQQVRHIKTYILRCHACFQKTKDMTKQFCPKCGKPTLSRVSCSTNAKGEFQIHLKKNMQWNHRGDRFSIPKPVPGSANGKAGTGKGGGKGGWGQELILAEDQKEYVRAIRGQGRKKEKNLMDEDYLPNILTGERARPGGRPKIGAGRNVNSKKR